MIDWTRLKDLKHEIGADDFPEVVELFIEEVSETVTRLREDPDPDTLGEDLHAMKGSALNLGFTEFSRLCQIGETRAREGRAEEIALAPLLDCYEESKLVFLAGLEGGQAG